MEKIKVALADDHDLVREGLIALLDNNPLLEIIIDVPNGARLLSALEIEKVDVVLLDLDMPVLNGQQTLEILKMKYPTIKCLIISMHYSTPFISQCFKLGAHGFLPKNSSVEILVEAIMSVYYNDYYFDEKVTPAVLKKLLIDQTFDPLDEDHILTEREVEIIRLICEGKKNTEIAEKLNISLRTAETHRKNISDKIGAVNMAGIVIYAIKKGIYLLD